MSLHKAIASGKEHRKGHVCPSGRDCEYCRRNRLSGVRRQAEAARQEVETFDDLMARVKRFPVRPQADERQTVAWELG